MPLLILLCSAGTRAPDSVMQRQQRVSRNSRGGAGAVLEETRRGGSVEVVAVQINDYSTRLEQRDCQVVVERSGASQAKPSHHW